MPYKDKTKYNQYRKQWRETHKDDGNPEETLEARDSIEDSGNPAPVETLKGNPEIPLTAHDLAWKKVMDFIKRPTEGRMSNLEALKRIAGSLGDNAGAVWFGLNGLTMEDIGSVIGTLPPLYGKSD